MMRQLLLILLPTIALAQSAITVNGASDAEIEPGVPLIVNASSTRGTPAPKIDGLTLTQRGGIEEEEIGRVQLKSGTWTVAPEDIAKLAPGQYKVQMDGARDAAFTVVSGATSESDEQRAARTLLLSAYAELTGDADAALRLATELGANQPDSIAARLRTAELLLVKGEFAAALRAVDEAETIFRRLDRTAKHPPTLIRELQARILDTMLQ